MIEFGYVFTDKNFKIPRKDECVVSPERDGENRFYLKGRKGQRDLEPPYEYDYYYEQPEFPVFYEKNKTLSQR